MAKVTLPCPAVVVTVLGFDQPTEVRCGEQRGHDGAHRYSIEWEPCATTWQEGQGQRCQLAGGHEGPHLNGLVSWGSY